MDGHAAVGTADVLLAVDGHVEAARGVLDLAEPVPPVFHVSDYLYERAGEKLTLLSDQSCPDHQPRPNSM